jgi:hypothetical protein
MVQPYTAVGLIPRTHYLDASADLPIDTFGGRSMIVDYKGRIAGRHDSGAGSSYVAGTIDIEALQDHRTRAQWDNWMIGLRTEVYQTIYEQPIYPKKLYPDRPPYNHADLRREVIDRQIAKMVERDIWLQRANPSGRSAPLLASAQSAPAPGCAVDVRRGIAGAGAQ